MQSRAKRTSHRQPVGLSVTQSFWKSVYQIWSRIQKNQTKTKAKDKEPLIALKPVIPLPGHSSKEIFILAERVFKDPSLTRHSKLHKGSD